MDTATQSERAQNMSLRDYFAAKAMQSFMNWALTKPCVDDQDSAERAAKRYAKGAFVIADAMMTARAKASS